MASHSLYYEYRHKNPQQNTSKPKVTYKNYYAL